MWWPTYIKIPSPFPPCGPHFTGRTLQVWFRETARGELHCINFPSPKASLFLQKDVGLSCTSASPPRCLQGSVTSKRCTRPVVTENPYQDLDLIGMKC